MSSSLAGIQDLDGWEWLSAQTHSTELDVAWDITESPRSSMLSKDTATQGSEPTCPSLWVCIYVGSSGEMKPRVFLQELKDPGVWLRHSWIQGHG